MMGQDKREWEDRNKESLKNTQAKFPIHKDITVRTVQ